MSAAQEIDALDRIAGRMRADAARPWYVIYDDVLGMHSFTGATRDAAIGAFLASVDARVGSCFWLKVGQEGAWREDQVWVQLVSRAGWTFKVVEDEDGEV